MPLSTEKLPVTDVFVFGKTAVFRTICTMMEALIGPRETISLVLTK